MSKKSKKIICLIIALLSIFYISYKINNGKLGATIAPSISTSQIKEVSITKTEDLKNVQKGDNFYFDQLSEKQKSIYLEIKNSTEKQDNEVEIEKLKANTDDVNKAISVFFFQNPNVFNLSKEYKVFKTRSGNVARIRISYNSLNDEFDYMSSEIKQVVDKLKEDTRDMDDYNKARYVYAYIVRNTEYVKTGPFINSMYGPMVIGKANCEGISSSYMYILNELDIPAWQIVGELIKEDGTKENHSWNLVKLGDNIYHTDATLSLNYFKRDGEVDYRHFNTTQKEAVKMKDLRLQSDILGIYPIEDSVEFSLYNKENLIVDNTNQIEDKLRTELKQLNSKEENCITIKYNNDFDDSIQLKVEDIIQNIIEIENLKINDFNVEIDNKFNVIKVYNIK